MEEASFYMFFVNIGEALATNLLRGHACSRETRTQQHSLQSLSSRQRRWSPRFVRIPGLG